MVPMHRELPPLLWLYFPPLAVLVVLAADLFAWPEVCHIMMLKDGKGGGVLEWGTPLVLLPGIVAAILAWGPLGRHPRALPIRTWLTLWILACIYFAGEEINWGQWLFRWETPEAFLALNDQGETNLHNMSNFLDQTPRAFVEAFIFVCALVLPVWRCASGRELDEAGIWTWLLPTSVCVPAALIWTIAQLTDWLVPGHHCRISNSELREFYIALVLGLYLLAIWRRARHLR